jgi:hypothetical protein
VSVSISGLNPYETYHYRLVATNLAGTNKGSDITFTTSALGPVAVTLAATNVSTTLAQLNGTVNPNGTPTTYYFEYGPTSSYGTQTSALSAGSGMSPSSVSAVISGLTSFTLYHFRLVVTSSIGTFRGSDMTVMTGSSPTASTLAATDILGAAAKLNGRVNPNGVPTTYYFEYGTTIDYGLQTGGQKTGTFTGEISVDYTLNNLASGTLYHYRLVATNIVGTAFGSDTTFIALALPPAVSTLPPTLVTPTTAQLNGTVNPNGATTTYYFEYGLTDSYGSQTSKMGAGSSSRTMSVSTMLINLTSGGSYHYRLVATNIGGVSRGSDVAITTSVLKPSTVTLAATRITGTTAQLNGTVNPNGPSTTCFFEYGPTTNYGLQTSGLAVGSGMVDISVNASISGLTPEVLYHYRLVATNSAGTNEGSDMTFVAIPVGIAADAAVGSYHLSQNFPNPFNPSTRIQYQLPKASNVVLVVVNALGQVVVTLDVGRKEAGSHVVEWTPMLPSGVYIYRLEAGDASTGSARGFVGTKKMILLK